MSATTLQVTIDLARSGYGPDGITRDEAIEILRRALFFTPLSFHIDDEQKEQQS